MLLEIFRPSSHVLETFQRKYENNIYCLYFDNFEK